jgi:hypothetical protein
MSQMTDEINLLIRKKKDEVKTLTKEILWLEGALKNTCQHDNIVERSSYIAGNYNDSSQHWTWEECIDCGTTFNTQVKYGSHG